MYKIFLFSVIALCSVNAYILDGAERIVGGGHIPTINYVISLQDKSQLHTIERGHRCGGALVSRQTALTTASCVIDSNGLVINANNFRVFAGTQLFEDNTNSVRDIARINVHPEYRPQTPYVNDIAVITLQAAFPNSIKPISMPSVGFAPILCQSFGFGARNATTTAYPYLIRLFPITPLSSESCNDTMGSLGVNVTILPSMICGHTMAGAGCVGDLGNPLVCTRADNQSPNVFEGLLTRNNNCTPDSTPEVYTRVTEFSAFVNQYLITDDNQPGAASTSQLGTAVALTFVLIQSFKIFT